MTAPQSSTQGMPTYTPSGEGPYETRSYHSTHSLPYQQACWFTESQIENYLAEPLYILRHTGIISEAPPLYKGPPSVIPSVRIHTYDYPGHRPEIAGMFGSMYRYPKEVYELNISLAKLQIDAVYIQELDISIALAQHRLRLHAVHPYFTDPNAQRYQLALNTICEQAQQSPLIVAANDPSNTHDTYYVILNGIVTGYPIAHSLNQPSVRLQFRSFESEDRCGKHAVPAVEAVIPTEEAFKPVIEVKIHTDQGSHLWFMGTSALQVREAYKRYMTALDNKYSESEFNEKLNDSIKTKEEELRISKQERERLSAELNTFKQKIRAQDEVIDQYRLNREQNHERTKWEWEREKHLRDAQWEERKHKQTHDVQELKVRKEHMSVRSSEASFLANAAKALVVIVPICASVFFLMKSLAACMSVFFSRSLFGWLGRLAMF